ncbi:hypothetical protein AB0F72_14010 [Actinoplanes sp. NPDC023936]|uniref:hypothetical protein n=1 Tax=Actinoplanes sp. NPDC023936 TaxID=3154910 RepID=UPI0033C075F1
MTRGGRRRGWVAVLAGGMIVAGWGTFLARQGLEKADQWAGVSALFVGLAGLGLAIFGVRDARRQAGGQSVTDSAAGGVTQIRSVHGNLRVGPGTPAGPPAAFPAGPPAASLAGPPAASSAAAGTSVEPPPSGSGGQSVTRTPVTGQVTQIDGIGGDAEVDR